MQPASAIGPVRTTGSLHLLRPLRSLAFLLLLFPSPHLRAQTGALDPSFNNGPIGVSILNLAMQTDGQILVGGSFPTWGATTISNVVRLNPDGTFDPSLATPPMTQFGGAFIGRINALAAQTDGKILVGGSFDAVGGVARTNFVRLNGNGTLDTGFNASAENGHVLMVSLQNDGSMYVGGAFNRIGGVARLGLARLASNGAVDSTFTPSFTGYIGAQVRAIAIQSDGKFVLGGIFTTFNGALAYFGVVRLNANGTLDGSFSPPSLPSNITYVNDLVLQPGGKIIVCGSFATIGGVSRQSIARLDTNGAIDGTWPGTGVFAVNSAYRYIAKTLALDDGKILIAGKFETYNGETSEGVARINPDGTRDQSFNSPVSTTFWAEAMVLQPGKGILIGGSLDVGPQGTSLVRLAGGVTQPTLTFSVQPGGVLRFAVPAGFKLQKVLNLGDTWGDVSGSTSIDVPMTDPRGFFQLKQ